MNKSTANTPAPIIRAQCSQGLPAVTASITTHDAESRQAVFYKPEEGSALTEWHEPVDNSQMAFFTLYQTAKVPTETNNDLDLHRQQMGARSGGPPLVIPNGVVCRMVDFAPGYSSADHRSLSIDYGVVIEGTIELILDSGETRTIQRGGMTLQRGTMHRWRNPSSTEWTRMFFVLVSAEPRFVGENRLEEELNGL